MSSSGRLSRKQKEKAAVTTLSPARDTSGDPLKEFESVHHEAMMDTGNLDVPIDLWFPSWRAFTEKKPEEL